MAFSYDSVRAAENEARRFLRRVREWQDSGTVDDCSLGGQYTAAIKRASMDLSRALADIRKTNT